MAVQAALVALVAEVDLQRLGAAAAQRREAVAAHEGKGSVHTRLVCQKRARALAYVSGVIRRRYPTRKPSRRLGNRLGPLRLLVQQPQQPLAGAAQPLR